MIEEEIRAAIWAPGARLPTERAFAERFGVSRAVVREAISRLKADGWVRSRQGVGAFVVEQVGGANFRLEPAMKDARNLRDLFDLRSVIEPGAAALAARRRSPGDVAALRRALQDMDVALSSGDSEYGAASDDRFHDGIAAATHSPHLQRLMSVVQRSLSGTRLPTWLNRAPLDLAAAAQAEHHRLFAAIEAGDSLAAQHAAHDHLVAAAGRLNLQLDSRDE
ncbi:FCD domain-containing protein [Niveibacterium umoris]